MAKRRGARCGAIIAKYMKKHHLFLLLLMAVPSMMMAQHVTRGQVVDRYGNPISGARVQGRGTTKSATTAIDGSFSLETMQPIRRIEVSAIGKAPTIKRVKKDGETRVKLNDLRYWNDKTGWRYYLGAQCALISKDSKDVPLGLMFGMTKDRWGFYIRGLYSGLPKYDTKYNESNYYYGSTLTDPINGSIAMKTGFVQASVGAMFRPVGPWYIYMGGGIMERRVTFTSSNTDYYHTRKSLGGLAYDIGSIVNLKYVSLNLGMTFLHGMDLFDTHNDEFYGTFHFGIGYMF